jgi:hypothetical protein
MTKYHAKFAKVFRKERETVFSAFFAFYYFATLREICISKLVIGRHEESEFKKIIPDPSFVRMTL